MRLVICDDDELFINQLSDALLHFFSSASLKSPVIKSFLSAEEMLEAKGIYDIAFLDVEMKGISGIVAANALKKRNTDILIFIITGNNISYLDEAMEEGVYRYMVKPLNNIQLIANMKAALKRMSLFRQISVETVTGPLVINTQDIITICYEKRKTILNTTFGSYATKYNFSFWTDLLPDLPFAVCYNGIIVNLKYVCSIGNNMIQLNTKPEDKIYMSHRKRNEMKKKFSQYLSIMV